MAKRCIAFDMDGTLIDSMHAWNNLKYNMLNAYKARTGHTLTLTVKDFETLEKLSLKGASQYLNRKYNASIDYKRDAFNVLGLFYLTECKEKPGVKEFLDMLKMDGVKMGVITATPKALAKAVLTRLELIDYFKFILTSEKYPGGKRRKCIFLAACRKFLIKTKNLTFIDDAAYAHETAKALNIHCVGLFDEYRADDLNGVADITYNNFYEMKADYTKNGKL